MKKVLLIALMSISFTSYAETPVQPDGADIMLRAMDDVAKIEKEVLGTTDKPGVLIDVYSCVMAQVATNALAKLVEDMFNTTIEELVGQVRNLPLGSDIIDELLKEDPNLLTLNLERLPYVQECGKEIAAAKADARVSDEILAKVLRLAEIGGAGLGQFMTSK
jgi:hypothetical protein